MERLRYLNKGINEGERQLYKMWWSEQINIHGMECDYFSHNYAVSASDKIYGEATQAGYTSAADLIILTNITNDSLLLGKFGIMADCDMAAYISIDYFTEYFGVSSEPKAGDLIYLKEYGSDRPNGRSGPVYEVTERDDEYLQETNALAGHYVWYIKCKRFEYSAEPGIVPEQPVGFVSDEEIIGTGAINEEADRIFDYEGSGSNDGVYGQY